MGAAQASAHQRESKESGWAGGHGRTFIHQARRWPGQTLSYATDLPGQRQRSYCQTQTGSGQRLGCWRRRMRGCWQRQRPEPRHQMWWRPRMAKHQTLQRGEAGGFLFGTNSGCLSSTAILAPLNHKQALHYNQQLPHTASHHAAAWRAHLVQMRPQRPAPARHQRLGC